MIKLLVFLNKINDVRLNMWLLLALFIIVKLLVYHKMQNLQVDMHHHKLCPAGYNGLNADPFDCNAYYMCPEKIKFYCPRNYQFNLDAQGCQPDSLETGCIGYNYRNLLL
ncbi:ORF12 [Helicoverpa armigera SNPV]|nr:ORF12 [Helicoverpa armigera SNPV]